MYVTHLILGGRYHHYFYVFRGVETEVFRHEGLSLRSLSGKAAKSLLIPSPAFFLLSRSGSFVYKEQKPIQGNVSKMGASGKGQ